MADKDFAWEPYGDYLENSRIARFMRKYGIRTWRELIRRSTEDIEWFWPSALEDLGVEWFRPYHTLYDDSQGMPWTKWFLGGKINIVHNCLDRHIRDGKGGKTALFWEDEGGNSRVVTYRKFYEMVNTLAYAMRANGIKKGDVVGTCMTVSPEAVAIMFAVMKIGAICMLPAARISPEKMAENLNQCQAKILFMQDGYSYGGKSFSLRQTAERTVEDVSSIKNIIIIDRMGMETYISEKCVSWRDFLALGIGKKSPKTLALDSEAPALILFSSGTTGRSKIIVHTHGGIMAQLPKEIGYAFDYRDEDVFYWVTNIGWMMMPWEVIGVQFFAGRCLLYDGAAAYPNSHRLFELIERYGVTILGVTPPNIDLLPKSEDYSNHNFSSLRILGSTGKPLKADAYMRLFDLFGHGRLPIVNISGGTELIGSLVSPLPVTPLKVSSVGAAGLGMDVAVVDEKGNLVPDGTEGLLVCRKPFPSMTRGFWGDPQRYLDTYFKNGPHAWYHGDRAMQDEDGLFYILGRDDDLIVKGGVKIDPEEVDNVLKSFPGYPCVRDAVTTGVDDEKYGDRIVSFVAIERKEGQEFSEKEFKIALRAHVTYDPFARPDEIHIVDVLPKTLSAKVPRKKYRRAYQGEDLGDLSSIDNPQGFDIIGRIGEEQRSKQ